MILALAGGVGGAKLAKGLTMALGPDELTIVVNTGDDFEHLGLAICPDLDSVCYALAGINNKELGWGIAGETWRFMEMLQCLGGEDWFRLGDTDLAIHVLRTQLLKGLSLSRATTHIAERLGIAHEVVPMSDEPVRSMVATDEGELPFQHYFVRRRCEPRFRSIRFEGAQSARPSPAFLHALENPDLRGVILCPSNPILSIAPILAIPGVRERLTTTPAPVVALSPFIGGRAVKGPADKIMVEIGIERNAAGLAQYYDDLLDGIMIDEQDIDSAGDVAVEVRSTRSLMSDLRDQRRVAAEMIRFADDVRMRSRK